MSHCNYMQCDVCGSEVKGPVCESVGRGFRSVRIDDYSRDVCLTCLDKYIRPIPWRLPFPNLINPSPIPLPLPPTPTAPLPTRRTRRR